MFCLSKTSTRTQPPAPAPAATAAARQPSLPLQPSAVVAHIPLLFLPGAPVYELQCAARELLLAEAEQEQLQLPRAIRGPLALQAASAADLFGASGTLQSHHWSTTGTQVSPGVTTSRFGSSMALSTGGGGSAALRQGVLDVSSQLHYGGGFVPEAAARHYDDTGGGYLGELDLPPSSSGGSGGMGLTGMGISGPWRADLTNESASAAAPVRGGVVGLRGGAGGGPESLGMDPVLAPGGGVGTVGGGGSTEAAGVAWAPRSFLATQQQQQQQQVQQPAQHTELPHEDASVLLMNEQARGDAMLTGGGSQGGPVRRVGGGLSFELYGRLFDSKHVNRMLNQTLLPVLADLGWVLTALTGHQPPAADEQLGHSGHPGDTAGATPAAAAAVDAELLMDTVQSLVEWLVFMGCGDTAALLLRHVKTGVPGVPVMVGDVEVKDADITSGNALMQLLHDSQEELLHSQQQHGGVGGVGGGVQGRVHGAAYQGAWEGQEGQMGGPPGIGRGVDAGRVGKGAAVGGHGSAPPPAAAGAAAAAQSLPEGGAHEQQQGWRQLQGKEGGGHPNPPAAAAAVSGICVFETGATQVVAPGTGASTTSSITTAAAAALSDVAGSRSAVVQQQEQQQPKPKVSRQLWSFKAGFQASKSSSSKNDQGRERLPMSSGAAAALAGGGGGSRSSKRGGQGSSSSSRQHQGKEQQQEEGPGRGRSGGRSWRSKIHDSAATVTNLLFGRRRD